MVCGDPDEVIEQLKRYEATGIDQISFSLPIDIPQEVCSRPSGCSAST
jgi:alkanesulfonate monooxygenase SsuD/methylene tetrahydromethanopterin reductase-like flavin-dependent oxidoreductase (luciferase family)